MRKLLFFFVLLTVVSCTTTRYIPVESKTTQVFAMHDTLETHDTIINNTNTIVRQLDSAAMKKWGITLANNEKAWLVETNALRAQISALKNISRDTVFIHDSISVPYPVTTDAKPNKWQTFLMMLGKITLITVPTMGIILYISRRYRS